MISDCEGGVAVLLGHGGYQNVGRGIEDAFDILILVCNVAPQRLTISGHEIDAKKGGRKGELEGEKRGKKRRITRPANPLLSKQVRLNLLPSLLFTYTPVIVHDAANLHTSDSQDLKPR